MIQPADFLHFCVLCTLAFSNEMAQAENLSVFKAFMSRWIFGHGGLLWSSVGAYHHHISSQVLVSITITSRSSKITQERKFPKSFLKSGSRRMLLKPPELVQMLVSFTPYAILTECFCNSDFLGFPILEHILKTIQGDCVWLFRKPQPLRIRLQQRSLQIRRCLGICSVDTLKQSAERKGRVVPLNRHCMAQNYYWCEL